MKKKITIRIILIVLVLAVAGLYLSRNQWAGYLLKKEVAGKSDGNVNLTFSAIHLDVFKKRLIVLNPSLRFKNTFINKDHTLKLEGSKFKRLSIYDLFLWNFFFRHEYICKEFEVVQPTFRLASGNRIKNNVNFNPTAWINILKDHRIGIIPIKFQIQRAYVKLGNIELVKSKKSGENGGAEYSITIEGLGNLYNRNTPGEISYNNLKVEIHNFYRNSKRENFSLKIDSISYFSSLQDFVVSGLHYSMATNNKAQNLNLNIRWAKVEGIVPDTTRKTMYIRDLIWRGGSITFPEGKLSELFSRNQPNKGLENLVKTFSFLKFGIFSINRVHVFRLASNSDTVLSINNFNVDILDAGISKKTFRNPLRFLTYSLLNTQMNGFYYLNSQRGDKINSQEISYKSKRKLITVSNLAYEKFCPQTEKPVWKFSSKQLKVENFSDERFRKKEIQNISTELLNPDIRIWGNRFCKPTGNDAAYMFDKFNFKSLNLKKGNFHYYGKERGTVSLSGFDLYAGNLRQQPAGGKNYFSYDTLYFQTSLFRLTNPVHRLKMSSDSVKWLNKELTLENIKLSQKEKGNQRIITVPSATFADLRLDSLVFKKKLISSEADLNNPNVVILQRDSLMHNDTIPFDISQLSQFPLKVSFEKVTVNKGHLNLTVIRPKDSLALNAGVDMEMEPFKMGYNKNQLVSLPSNWSFSLGNASFWSRQIHGKVDSVVMSSPDSTLNIRNVHLSTNKNSRSNLRFNIRVPLTQINTIDYAKLFRSDSLVFGKIALQNANLHFNFPKKLRYFRLLPVPTVLFDSLEIHHSGFTIERKLKTSNLKVTGGQLDVLYKPLLRSAPDSLATKDFLKKWDITLKNMQVSDTINHIRVNAEGISLQSQLDQLFIDSLAGSNLPEKGALKGVGKDYASFRLHQMKFSGLRLTGPGSKELKISKWTTPYVWLKILRETGKKKQPKSTGLMASLFNKSSKGTFINALHIDSTQVKKLNFNFLYENGKKQIDVHDVGIEVNDIALDSTLESNHPNYIFRNLKMDARGKSIISGDSMYAFRTRDIRINLPLRRISLDSITVTPRYQRDTFFKKEKKQTDRVTVYGKSIDFNNFDFPDLLKKKIFRVGNVSLNQFNVLFQRDKHYPLSDSAQPMPLEMLREIPYKFKADSILIKNGFISYYEYEKKSTHPGIFFINNFNVYFLNVTNDFATLDSTAVLRIHGKGQMMRTSGLNFVLVMPYFSPENRFWFSAQTSHTDLTQFNSLARNIVGISIVSGAGSADVQYVSGNNKFAKGNMLFEYKNLKLRLYNRRKAKMNKGLGSPFVNFMLNNLMIRTNNPKFLKPPHKGVVYFERDPRKSFINYLWKSCFSGITSTMGFNNRQQRHEMKAEKKEMKAGE